MDEMKSTRDLIEDVERDIYLKIKSTDVNDPNWQKLINGAKTASDIRNAMDTAENTRLNNNARNDIEEQKLVVDEERIKVDKQRNLINVLTLIGYASLGVWSAMKSYSMDEVSTCYRKMSDFAKDCQRSVLSVFGRK